MADMMKTKKRAGKKPEPTVENSEMMRLARPYVLMRAGVAVAGYAEGAATLLADRKLLKDRRLLQDRPQPVHKKKMVGLVKEWVRSGIPDDDDI